MSRLFVLAMIILWPCLIAAQPSSVEGLDAKIASIFGAFNNNASPGCAVTVLEDGKVIARKDFGMASLELNVPFTHRSVVRMPYSEGREFISIAAVLMEKDGKLKLDDPVRKYFTGLPEWASRVTVLDLLNHRSGFVDEWAEMMLTQASMANRFDVSEFLNLLYRQPMPSVEPGKGYMYSNSDFGLLRLILEKASGKNLTEWLDQRVFGPLKMSSTRMQDNPLDIVPDRAAIYAPASGRKYRLQPPQKSSPGGNYYILTNADDLERWAAAQNDPTSEIATATAWLSANVRTIPNRTGHYVFGHSNREIGHEKVVFHEGVNGFNYLTRIPSKRLTVITIGNRSGSGFADENRAIVEYLLGSSDRREPSPASPRAFATSPIHVAKDELRRYEGRYLWLKQTTYESDLPGRRSSDFIVQGDALTCRNCSTDDATLIPVGKGLFYFKDRDDIGFQIEFSQSGSSAAMTAEVRFSDGYPSIKLQRESKEIWKPNRKKLTAFVGRYYSKHLDYYWTLAVNEKGELFINRPTVADTVVEPDGLDQFHLVIQDSAFGGGSDGWMTFHRDTKGRITHFTVWNPRLMHHRFDRVTSPPAFVWPLRRPFERSR